MKFLLTLFAFSPVYLYAAGECASVWLYRDCAANATTPDLSQPGIEAHHMTLFSDFSSRPVNESQLCNNLRDNYNTEHSHEGLYAEVIPVPALNGDMVRIQEHRAECNLTVTKYPFKRVCGPNEKFQQKVGGNSAGLPADSICLSCDNLRTAKPEVMAACLRQNILTLNQAHDIALHTADYQALAREVADILEENQTSPIPNLQTREQLAPLEQFLHDNPLSQNQNSSGGGIGSHPTQQ
jgi:hypothetical protein